MVKRLLTTALIALVLMLGVNLTAAAIGPGPVYLPLVRSAPIRVTGTIQPPNGLHCLLQQGTSRVIDPRTDAEVWSCEATDGFGQIVFTSTTLLLDHVAVGSGSLSVTDGVVYITAVNKDGSLQNEVVPTP